MDRADIARYNERGYLSLPGLIPPDVLAALRAVTDDLVASTWALRASNGRFDLGPDHSSERPRVRRIHDPVTAAPEFAELMRSDLLLDAVCALLGPDVRFQGGKLNVKYADGGAPVEWHQDFAFYPHTNADLLAAGIALDDSDRGNGCLLVVPGSHRGPVLDHHQDGVFVGAISPGRAAVDLGAAVPLEMSAGGVSIHHAKTLHASAPNRSARPRRLLLLQYAAADAWPMLSVADVESFDAAIVRGAPARTYRVVADEIRIPLPEPALARSIFEIQDAATEREFADG